MKLVEKVKNTVKRNIKNESITAIREILMSVETPKEIVPQTSVKKRQNVKFTRKKANVS
jgi:hypothetical protein